jgi:hypothetical protein
MKDKVQVLEHRNHSNILNWPSAPQELEDDFLSGKMPVYFEDTWEEE